MSLRCRGCVLSFLSVEWNGMRRNNGINENEKVAQKISNLLSDLRVDLDLVGFYLAQAKPHTIYNRFMIIAEAAESQRIADEESKVKGYVR